MAVWNRPRSASDCGTIIRRAICVLLAIVLITVLTNAAFLRLLFGGSAVGYDPSSGLYTQTNIGDCITQCLNEITVVKAHQLEEPPLVVTTTASSLGNLTESQRCEAACRQAVSTAEAERLSFIDTLTARAFSDKIIILAYVDLPFVDMAANFYETSLKAHGLTQFVFAVSGADCCLRLEQYGIPASACIVYRTDAASGQASSYGSKDFIRKMNIRTDMILDALREGFTVLHTDIDVVFAKDPLPALKTFCRSCDIAALWDDIVFNAGFLFIRSTPASIAIYQRMQALSRAGTPLDDQQQLNGVIRNMTRVWRGPRISAVKLNVRQFLCGKTYFETAKRVFAGDNACAECIVVHNNWIVSEEAKIYRFREHHMWMVDRDEYYSSMTQNYLTFDLPYTLSNNNKTRALERATLASALAIGQVLNRTVILPKFHCYKGTLVKLCPLNDIAMLTNFEAQFAGRYREHTFLQHPKVPPPVKDSLSMFYRIDTLATPQFDSAPGGTPEGSYNKPIILRPKDEKNGATSDEIRQWFSSISQRVLRFHSLYGAFGKFSLPMENEQFLAKVAGGIVDGNYRQYTDSKWRNLVVF